MFPFVPTHPVVHLKLAQKLDIVANHKIGPKTDPCVTPQFRSLVMDLTPSITTVCVLFWIETTLGPCL